MVKEKKLKVGVFSETHHPQINGVVAYVDGVSEELIRLGHKVEVYAPAINGFKDSKKYIHRLPGIKAISRFDPNQRLVVPVPTPEFRKMMSSDFDIIHAHTGGPVSLLGMQIAKTKGIPYVLTYHTLLTEYRHMVPGGKIISPKVIEVASRMYCNSCDAILAPTQKIKDELLKYGVTRPIFVLSNSVDAPRFTGNPRGYLREKFGVSGKIILYVGRISAEKNMDFLVRSFAKVAGMVSDATLVIVGKGAEEENLKELVKELGLEKRVLFTGPIPMDEVAKAYADGDIFALTSVTEVHPMVILEAVVSGLPIVTVKDGAYTDSVKDGVNGYQTDMDESKYAGALIELLEDDAKRKKFSQASLDLGSEFGIAQHARKLVEIYEAVIANHQPSRISEALTNMGKLVQMADVAYWMNKLK